MPVRLDPFSLSEQEMTSLMNGLGMLNDIGAWPQGRNLLHALPTIARVAPDRFDRLVEGDLLERVERHESRGWSDRHRAELGFEGEVVPFPSSDTDTPEEDGT
ncbi:MAG: hypothetical protein QNK04_18270 [Myxococcota bacterium]|nr:hypothetical protein [Myxococcota bacterium]